MKLFNFRGRFGFMIGAQNTIVSAAAVLAISAGVTAILGLVKSRLLTSSFGVSTELGVFYTADRIPTLIYSIIVIGAISTVFIPVFTDLLKNSKEEAWVVASSVISAGVLVFVLLSVIVILFANPIIELLSINTFTPEEVELGANLMRIMIFGQLVLVVGSFTTSVLQSFRRFFLPAMAPIFYNIGMIAGIIILAPYIGIYGPAVGVVIGAFFHLLIQTPSFHGTGFKYRPTFDLKNKNVKEMMHMMPPRVTTVVFNQTVATISNSLALTISTSSNVILKFASQLQFFPVSLFGMSMAAAALPVLSEHSSPDNKEDFKKIFLTTMHQMLFLVLPASAILLILRVPVVRLVYGVDNFTWEDTIRTSYALAFFSLSIFAQSTVYLITRAFYAFRDTITPVKVSLITIVLNVCLSLFFVNVLNFGVWALAFSFSITAVIDVIILLYLLADKLGGFNANRLFVPFIKIGWATVFMAISLYVPLKFLDQAVFDTTKTINLLALTVVASLAGMLSYLFFTWLFKVEEIELFYKLLRKLKLKETAKSGPVHLVPESQEGI